MKILLVVYNNDSYIHWFPQGLAYIAAVLDREGYEIEVYNQDVHHYPDEHLTEYLNKNHFDIICVATCLETCKIRNIPFVYHVVWDPWI